MIQTYGMFMNDGTSDDYFNSDYIVLWCANPVYTRIPDMHFLTEARYRGAALVVIGPDYNATATTPTCGSIRKFGTDPALALAMAQVMIAEKLDRPRLRPGADRPAVPRPQRQRPLPARARPASRAAATTSSTCGTRRAARRCSRRAARA